MNYELRIKNYFVPLQQKKLLLMRSAVIGIIVSLLLVVGCTQPERRQLPVEGNAVYYWRTDFRLDSTELAFLNDYHVKRLYCRYFDVVGNRPEGPMPNATVTFSSPVPAGIEMVPTVFITEDCMHRPCDSLARLIVDRILQMNETHDIMGVKEIQIDCDFTARSRKTYYRFLEQVRSEAKKHRLALSTTIRLHQLSMPEPPADYGVLMLYNTRDPQHADTRNPILDIRDVKPYVRYLKDYPLPLGAAYPVFLWQRDIHGVHLHHQADMKDIIAVKQAVEQERDDLKQLIITYHLSTENIHRYTPNDYEKIYHH